VSLRDSERRIYPQGTTAEHAVGYVGAINADELLTLAPQGYSADDVLGRAALEKWGEKYLRGDLGGTLVVLQPDGQIVATLGARGPTPGRNIYTTLDAGLQKFVEQELGTKTGAAIVLDVRTDEILALASNPGFDLNTLVQGTSQQVQQLLNDSKHPLINRATQGLYPTGSVFKIVTISAGLEKGGFTPDSQFQCNGIWTGLGGQYAKRDWLSGGHGRLNLFSGLVQSCDIVFYDVGLALDKKDRSILPTYARAFGFGAPTNGPGLTDEAAGNVPDPAKGNVFVGPFQVANMLAAVGNGGTLNRPRLVAKVSGPNDERRQDFPTEAIAKLPVSAGNLKVIQAALKAVTSTGPGTAAFAFAGSKIQVAGKTGTAESPPGEPHAWFAAYAPADDPRIAVVVMIEHSGEGSVVAAPIVRKILEKYLNQK
ncbi:MAG: penicillin-binding protein 2, partial [Chloroflexi bacterium]